MPTTRLEAFSDGVFAIAITILVLDLRVPPPALAHGGRLGHLLLGLWPNYASYVVSFLVIGIIWVNHHGLFHHVGRVDRPLLFLNLLLLLFVVAIPFPTAVLAEYVNEGGPNSHAAAAAYSLTMLGMALSFGAVWIWAVRARGLLAERVDPAAARATVARFTAGNLAYLALVGLAFVSAPLTLVGHFLLAVYYVFNRLPDPSWGMPGGSKPAPRDGDASLATEVTKKAAGEPPKEPSDTPQSRRS
jgi:uncharacterized membrane protein